ncbi:MAG: hypothetical protein FWC60_09760 [Firmicutes bacterium]|nr:hypothetical protein [Bacillota bacterium]
MDIEKAPIGAEENWVQTKQDILAQIRGIFADNALTCREVMGILSCLNAEMSLQNAFSRTCKYLDQVEYSELTTIPYAQGSTSKCPEGRLQHIVA